MKFVHMADLHLDSPFSVLAGKENLAIQRRLEQRKAMKEIVEYIKNNGILYFFISGDLYEQEYITRASIEYINQLFLEIPNTKIFITPGNHDPYINNSFYKNFKWAPNVHIFSDRIECIETEEIDIYGYGFNDFYMKNMYSSITIKNSNKINILITHGSLDASDTLQNQYNPIKTKDIKQMGFDYVALGHIHKKSFNDYENQNIVYPGSTVSLGFDELGERGVIVGEIQKNKINLEFIKINTKSFEEKEFDVSELNSQEDIIQMLNDLPLEKDSYYKIILIGKKNFTINQYEIMETLQNEKIIKIKDSTQEKYDIERIALEQNLAGLFAKNILRKIENAEADEKEELLKAFEVGIEVLKK